MVDNDMWLWLSIIRTTTVCVRRVCLQYVCERGVSSQKTFFNQTAGFHIKHVWKHVFSTNMFGSCEMDRGTRIMKHTQTHTHTHRVIVVESNIKGTYLSVSNVHNQVQYTSWIDL